jgi:hypothetical protein
LSRIEAIGADWKYLGGAALPKGQQAIVFYDSESIEYTKEKTIKVWTKSFKLSDFISVKNRNENKVKEKSVAKQKLTIPLYLEIRKQDLMIIKSFLEAVVIFSTGTRWALFKINALII